MATTQITTLTQLEKLSEFRYGQIIINFWAEWSKPSKQMNAVFEQLAKNHPSIKFVTVEAEEVGEVTEKYSVESVPAFIFLTSGKQVNKVIGANPQDLSARVGEFGLEGKSAKEELWKRLESLINSADVVGFIKGTPEAPRCGFSGRFCKALQTEGVEFKTFDILSDQAVRQGLKEYSQWPTYPQLYIKGKLVGGLDTLTELVEDGEFKDMLA
mmetsp:Transcript_11100/g.12209  ORF Transcript_11100/g.12209 Transcript_11100/m.12209 type:complete len:213 (-) Transcript_11100:83-721(-)